MVRIWLGYGQDMIRDVIGLELDKGYDRYLQGCLRDEEKKVCLWKYELMRSDKYVCREKKRKWTIENREQITGKKEQGIGNRSVYKQTCRRMDTSTSAGIDVDTCVQIEI